MEDMGGHGSTGGGHQHHHHSGGFWIAGIIIQHFPGTFAILLILAGILGTCAYHG